MSTLALGYLKKNLGPTMRFELCTPGLEDKNNVLRPKTYIIKVKMYV